MFPQGTQHWILATVIALLSCVGYNQINKRKQIKSFFSTFSMEEFYFTFFYVFPLNNRQIVLILALKAEQTGPVSLVRTLDIIFGFIWQFIFWQILPDFYW